MGIGARCPLGQLKGMTGPSGHSISLTPASHIVIISVHLGHTHVLESEMSQAQPQPCQWEERKPTFP